MTRFGRRPRVAGLAALTGIVAILLISPPPASAQLARAGDTILTLGGSGARTTTDTAYDPANDVYLVLSASGPIIGVFVNAVNQPVSGTFLIYDGLTGFGHNPRVRYSPDVPNGVGGFGAFLVVWDNGVWTGSTISGIRGSFVSYAGGAGHVVTAPIQLSDPLLGSIFMENRPSVAYSATSHRFLIAWTTQAFGIQGRFLSTTGLAENLLVFETGTSRDPALAWNPATNLFGLGNTGFSGAPYAQFRLVSPTDGTAVGRTTFGFVPTGTFATGLDINAANQFVMTWGLAPGTRAATFDANGVMLSGPTFISAGLGGDLSMGLAYNRNSGTFLAVSSSWSSYDIGGVELTGGGSPNSLDTIVTAGASAARPSFYPLVAARVGVSEWNVAHSRGFLDARTQIVVTSATGGGSGVPLPPATPGPTPGPAPAPGGCTTPDPFAAIGGGQCVNGGWLPKPPAPTPAPAPAPAPTPTPAPNICTTPDPFAAIGGGHCVGGGWLPGPDPGSPAPAPAPTPAPTPSPTPSPTPTCTTPDPFVAIGGGHCVGGGWLPGPDPGTPAPAPTPAPSPSPSPSPGTCTTPDPFASIGGGKCVNGGWLPKTMGAQLMPAWSPVRGDLHVNDARLALVRRITA